jgi:hypothetical protein
MLLFVLLKQRSLTIPFIESSVLLASGPND